MTWKCRFLIAISTILLSIGGVVLLKEVGAQVACIENANCAGGLSCISGRCNLPPPIWNVAGTSLEGTGQSGQIFLTGVEATNSARFGNLQLGLGNQLNNLASCGSDTPPEAQENCEVSVNWSAPGGPRVGRGFSVYNGDEAVWFRIDRDGNVSITNNLLVGGTIRGNFVSSTGAACTRNQVLRRNGGNTAWECVAFAGATGACTGAVYQGPSGTDRDGNRGGYVNANAECNLAFGGAHVCRTSEILESLNCGAFGGRNTNGGVPMWINNLAPSLPTPTNDCAGWTVARPDRVGVAYTNNAVGGYAGTATCDSNLRFACCR